MCTYMPVVLYFKVFRDEWRRHVLHTVIKIRPDEVKVNEQPLDIKLFMT